MRMSTILVVSAALSVALTGCGGPSAAEKQATAAHKREVAAKKLAADQAKREAELRTEQQATFDACEAQLGAFRDALDEINSRLAVGITYSDYGSRLGDARVAYDKIDTQGLDDISSDCLAAAADLEGVYNLFIEVNGIWSDCIDDLYCDFETGKTSRTVQAKWSRAGTKLHGAEARLKNMEPGPVDLQTPTSTPSPA